MKTVKEVSDEEVLKAEMADGDLVITPLKAGKADINYCVHLSSYEQFHVHVMEET